MLLAAGCYRNFYTPRTTDCGSILGNNSYLDKEHSAGTLQQHSYPILGDPSSAGSTQLEASASGKGMAEAGATAAIARKGSVGQLQGIPEVASEQLTPEQSDMQQEASQVRA